MTEVRRRPTPRVRFREMSVKRELTVNPYQLQLIESSVELISLSFLQDLVTQTKHYSTAVIENLQAKVVDLEHRLRQPNIQSAEEAIHFKARLQDSEDALHETEAYCKTLEAKAKKSKEEVRARFTFSNKYTSE